MAELQLGARLYPKKNSSLIYGNLPHYESSAGPEMPRGPAVTSPHYTSLLEHRVLTDGQDTPPSFLFSLPLFP